MKAGVLSILFSAVFPATQTVPDIYQVYKNNFRMVKWWNNPWSVYLGIYHILSRTQMKHHDKKRLLGTHVFAPKRSPTCKERIWLYIDIAAQKHLLWNTILSFFIIKLLGEIICGLSTKENLALPTVLWKGQKGQHWSGFRRGKKFWINSHSGLNYEV